MRKNYKVLITRALSLSMVGSLFSVCPVLGAENNFAEDLIISEYLHGPSNSKAIEIYNGTGESVNLSDYDLAIYSNGKYDGSPVSQALDNSIVNHGETFIVYNKQGKDATFNSTIDGIEKKLGVSSQPLSFNGDDVVLLRKDSGVGYEVIDSFGAKTQKGKNFYNSKYITAQRKGEIKLGESNIDNNPFDINVQWDSEISELYSDLGKHDVSWDGENPPPPTEDIISIDAARDKNLGEEVNIRGVVSYNDRNKTLHIQDETGAIAISNFDSKIDLSEATKGNEVEVVGVLDDFNALLQVQATKIKVLEDKGMPNPKVVTIKELKEQNFDSHYVEIKNATVNIEEKTLTQGSDVLDIYFVPADINVETGDLVNVKGVVGRFRDNVQLYGASAEFIEIVDDKEAPVITHEAVTKANLNENLVIEAMVTDNHKVSEVAVYHKGINENEFKKTVATESEGKYSVTINKDELNIEGLNYYIEASDALNTSRVPVEGVFSVEVVDEDLNGPEVTNVYPSENSSIGENRTPVISGEFKEATGVDASSVIIKLDGQDVTSQASITEEGFNLEVKEALEDGDHRVEVILSDTLGNESSKEWKFRIGKLNHYYGQLHSHTNISDGTGSLNDAYEWARDEGNADYFAVSDHSNWFDNDTAANINDASMSKAWTEAQSISDDYNVDGEFVSMYGYEMTWSGSTGGWGHINTFNTPGFETRKNSDMDLKTYYDTVAKLPKSVSQLNHPGKTFGDFADFGFYSEGADNVVNLIEVGNGEGPVRGSGYFPSYEYYTRALDKGWHIAPTNNQDNHKGKWMTANEARTIIVAEEKTREALYEAMNDRQVYSSEDKNMIIDYSVNGQTMGSNLGEPEKLNFNISINDEDKDDVIKKVSIIANGGVEVISKEFTGNTAEWNFELDPEYTYYYVKVVQGDKDIAVTAPVWVGESINIGLNELETDKEMLFVGDTAKLSIGFYNNSSSLLNDIKVEFFSGEVSEENKIGEEIISSVEENGLKEVSINWSPEKAGEFNIYAKATVNIDGIDKTFTKSLRLEVVNEGDVYKVMIDGAHSNQYVTGNYAGKIDAFEKLLMDNGAIPMINMDEITSESLEDVDLLILTDPQGTDNPKYDEYKSKFTESEIQAIGDFVKGGGNIVVTTRADYKDGIGEYSNGEQLNPILEATGASLRVNDDQVADYEQNEGQQYRLMFNNYESRNYNLVEGLDETDLFSFYSGASVILAEGETGEKVDFLVKGHETTRTDDADKAGDNVPVEKGDVNVLGVEELPNGSKVIVGGSTFFSNFEIDDTNTETKSNIELVQNIIEWVLPEKEAEKISIKDFRSDEDGDGVPDKLGEKYTLEGIVTSQSEAIEPKNAFFEVIYIQDETGGVNVFGVSNTPVKVGQKVRVSGTVQAYQGEFEIEIKDEDANLEIIDESINEVETKKLSTGDSMLHENEGWLTEVKGTVVDMDSSNLYIDDGSGVSRVYVEGYIWDGINEDMKGKWNPNIKVGDNVSAIGLASEDPEGNRLRVRNTGEIVLHEEEEIIVSPVKEFMASQVNKKNVTVTWKEPENTTGLESYILYKDGRKVKEIDSSQLEYTFKGLKRHTIYNFKIAAKYSNGEISSKESITLRTAR